MKPVFVCIGAITAALAATAAPCHSQQRQPPVSHPVGNPVGLPVMPAADGRFNPVSPNVKVYGAVYSAESCSYDSERKLIVIPNRGVTPNVRDNDAWVALLNHDGSVHTPRWIGVQDAGRQRESLSPPLKLNEPYGSDIVNGILYLADRNTDTTNAPLSVIRRFEMRTGAPMADIQARGAPWFNDIAIADDGTVYGSATGANQIWRIAPDGAASVFFGGSPLDRPNGVAVDRQGNVVVVNTGDDAVLTFSPSAKLLLTERAAQPGSDGIVIMHDGTKYVSSVINGGISRIRPNQQAELIAQNIPSAASMCYDTDANQLVIPMNANNAIAFVKLQ